MKYPELTALKGNQVAGTDDEKLDVLKKYGVAAVAPDITLLTGPMDPDTEYVESYDLPTNRVINMPIKSYQTKTFDDECNNLVVNQAGILTRTHQHLYLYANRPIIQNDELFDRLYPYRTKGEKGTEEVVIGEYPLFAVDSATQECLELEYNALSTKTSLLKKTKYDWTFWQSRSDWDVPGHHTYDGYVPIPHKYYTYEYRGKLYVRVRNSTDLAVTLSNNKVVEPNEYVWLEVSPVTWLVDKQTKTLVSKYCLACGVVTYKYETNVFEKTKQYLHMNKEMAYNLFQREPLARIKQSKKVEKESKDRVFRKKEILKKLKEDIKFNKSYSAINGLNLEDLLWDILKILNEEMKDYFMDRYNNLREFYFSKYKRINIGPNSIEYLSFNERYKELRNDLDKYINSLDYNKKAM